MKKTSFATGVSLAGLSAAQRLFPEVARPAWTPASPSPRFEFAPHVLYGMSHEICSRAVDRLLYDNVDFVKILEENTGYWSDDSFSGWDRVFWNDYRPTDY